MVGGSRAGFWAKRSMLLGRKGLTSAGNFHPSLSLLEEAEIATLAFRATQIHTDMTLRWLVE